MSDDGANQRRTAGLLCEALGVTNLTPWQNSILDMFFADPPPSGPPARGGERRNRALRSVENVRVYGRPAPQGSKRVGMSGQMMEQSPYLVGWAGGWKGGKARGKRIHGAVERALYEHYRDHGIEPDELPYLTGPVGVDITFYLEPDHGPVEGPPDVDKLARSTFDALTAARLWEDDARVIDATLRKRPDMLPFSFEQGALIRAWEIST